MQIKSHYPLVAVSAGEQSAVAHEIWVNCRLFGGDATGGIVFEHGFEHVDTVSVEARDKLAEVIALPLGKGGLEVGE